jgi:transcription antitermination factor NusG
MPLFSGYVFCRFDLTHRLAIGQTPGVVEIVGTSRGPLPIDAVEMTYLQTTVWSQVAIVPHPFLQAGQWVRVERGPLAGVEGILKKRKGDFRIVVSVSLLRRSVAAELDVDWVRSCGPASRVLRETSDSGLTSLS